MKHLTLILVLLGWTTPAAADSASKVAKLRAEVERLASEVRLEREDGHLSQRALKAQVAELELQVRLETIRRDSLTRTQRGRASKTTDVRERSQGLTPAVEAALQTVRSYVQTTPPFRRADRLKAIEALLERLQRPDASPVAVLSRLWQFLEDEITLSRDVGIHAQVIAIDGDERLVDVLHLGMALLYFRDSEGHVGWYTDNNFSKVDNPELAAGIATLFTLVEKNQHRGAVALPMPPGTLL